MMIHTKNSKRQINDSKRQQYTTPYEPFADFIELDHYISTTVNSSNMF